MLLAITQGSVYRQRLMEATAAVLEQPSDRYLFLLSDDVHPTTIGKEWRKIGALDRQGERPTISGGLASPYLITAIPHVFIS